MKTGAAWRLVPLLILLSCQTAPHLLDPVKQPESLPDLLGKAQKELDAGQPLKAWVMLKNSQQDSAEEKNLLSRTERALLDKLQQAQGDAASASLAEELDVTLRSAGLLSDPAPAATTPTEVPSSNTAATGPTDWLKGTVTVVVNKGLKLEHGTAVPDIVIGSGFFIDKTGYLITNHHVIASEVEPGATQTTRISLRLAGSKGERLPAKVIGWDKNHDLALLKAEIHPEYVFSFAPAVTPVPGQRLQALGSPGGLESTLTEGIVSALKRPLLPMGEVFQIDVAVNPGNSGGPLVDSAGRVVGVVFAGIQDFQGVNFAIPAEFVTKMLPRLRKGGAATVPWMGLGLQEDLRGLEVIYVLPQSPADWAGFHPGDRIVSFAGTPVKEIAAAQNRILDFGTESAIAVEIQRDGKPLTLWSTLSKRPDDPLKVAADSDLAGKILPVAFGIVAEDVGTPVDRSFRVKRVLGGSDGEELQLLENDPLTILDWRLDTEKKTLVCLMSVKRRMGGYFEAQVELEAPFASRQFL